MRILTLLLILLCNQVIMGQTKEEKLSKKERKALIKQAKSYKANPEKLKELNEELKQLRSDNARRAQEVSESNTQLAKSETRVKNLEKQLADLKVASRNVVKDTKAAPETTEVVDLTRLIFRVQIGGFKQRDMKSYDDAGNFVKVDTNSKGTQEIALGKFNSYKKANEFKKHLRAMGLKDAWIVPYKDGQRVPLKDVVPELDI